MHKAVLENSIPQAVHILLPKMLPKMPMRATRLLRQQAGLLLLQQLEDQARWSQVSVDFLLVLPLAYDYVVRIVL